MTGPVDETMWIEVLGRHRETAARFRIDGNEALIGRGYGNDVVLDDPHVAPAHLRVYRNAEGALVAQDLGSVNGIRLERGKQRLDEVLIEGDRPLRIGQTLIRVRDADFAVAPERSLKRPPSNWPAIVLMGAAFVFLTVMETSIGQTREAKAASYLGTLAPQLVLGAIWVTGWSLVCRVFSGAARFERHLLIALEALIGMAIAGQVVVVAAFAFALPVLVQYPAAPDWVILGIAVLAHLRTIGPGRMRLKLAAAAAIPVLVVGYEAIAMTGMNPAYRQPAVVRQLMPPELRLVPNQSTSVFFEDAAGLKPGLDKARTEEAADAGDGDED
jgi:pSer/pThr/pTyr-binding forkhead associated (FHA) protein